MQLSGSAFDRAMTFMRASARELDRALLEHELYGSNGDAVIAAVAEFQNRDGGFGNAIEPDLRTPASTAIGTTTGLRALRAVAAPATSSVVADAIGYLVDTVDRAAGVWPIITPEVDLAPHAPWWAWSDELAESWNGFRFNPTAEALALLYEYRELVPEALLAELTHALTSFLADTERLDSYYDLHCCISLYRGRDLPDGLRAPLAETIRASLEALDPADEHTNFFELCPRPDEFIYPQVAEAHTRGVAAAIVSQDEEGCWSPFWDWSFVDEKEWRKARVEWQGVLTRSILTSLHHHGMIEPE